VKPIEEKKTFAEELNWIVLLMKLYEDDMMNFPFIIIYFQSIETLSNVFACMFLRDPNEQAISILYERLNRIESEELLSN
jgi:hypothetical protein